MNGAQIVVEVLKKQGVEYIFGYPGGACMPIFDALVDAPELKIILVRHEQGATHTWQMAMRGQPEKQVLSW